MPTRVIRDGCLDSERIEALSLGAEVFYKRLWMIVDDFGRYEYSPVVLLSKTFPRRVREYTEQQIEKWMCECSTPIRPDTQPLVVLYRVGFKIYLQITDFGQRIRPDTQSKWPAPNGDFVLLSHAAPLFADFCGESPRDSASRARSPMTSTPTPTPTPEGGLGETRSSRGDAAPAGVAIGRKEPLSLQKAPPEIFLKWWPLWSSVRGTNHQEFAFQAFIAEITPLNFLDFMECTRSYLAGPGADPSSGYNPENFIRDQAPDQYRARWPARRLDKKAQVTEIFTDRAAREAARELERLGTGGQNA
jgi:hypothetical protein